MNKKDESEIVKALNDGNHETMYLSDEQKTEPEPKKSVGYIKSLKNKIYQLFKYFIKS